MSEATPAGEAADGDEARRYGTLEGVFVPTLLTILGVILFLRTGWVVGNAGLLGSLGIIALAFAITGLTALSLASISTNVTPGAGGAYALVARSFGVEAGGGVGLSLYLSQSLVIVLYLFGFRDGWLVIFPGHPPALVDLVAVLALIGVTLIGTKAAFRVQYLILAVVAVALGAVAVAAFTAPMAERPPLVGSFPGAPEDDLPGTGVWAVFAVFFPATTGIMAGLNMSGELRDAGRSIKRGTLAAVGVAVVIYLAVAVWLAFAVPTDVLVNDYLAMADRSAWRPAVLAGLLAATFSSALASLVGAPRILQALAEDGVPPAPGWLSARAGSGEPRNALLVTIVVVAAAMLLRDLNAIAPLITLVFLLTYGAINAAVLAEIIVDLPSYRPTFRVPWPVPLLGALGCFGAMLVIDIRITVIALVAVAGALVWVSRRDVTRTVPDIRAAMLLEVARRATRAATRMASSEERTWSPRFLVPVRDDVDLDRARGWVPELVGEGERVRVVPLRDAATGEELQAAVRRFREDLQEKGVDASAPDEEVEEGGRGPVAALVAAGDTDDPESANVVLGGFPEEPESDRQTRLLLREAFDGDAGVLLLPPHPPEVGEDDARITLWLRGQGPRWELGDHLPHSDLALLIAYRLTETWGASLTLATAVARSDQRAAAEEYLEAVVERARLPGPPSIEVIDRSFREALEHAPPRGDLHILALSGQTDFHWLREVRDLLGTPCLFVRDSGIENAFA
ncbi:MAG: amino acid permease [Nitriliruptor sp.]